MMLRKEKLSLKDLKPWSRKKIVDEYAGLLKADGTPMSRQQVHMLRKKSRGICLTCDKPALGVYCAEHTIQARERMRKILHSRRRHWNSPSYKLQVRGRAKSKPVRIRPQRQAQSRAA